MEQKKIVRERIISSRRRACLKFYGDDIEECTVTGNKKLCGKLAKASYNNCMENAKDIAIYTIYTNTDKPEH